MQLVIMQVMRKKTRLKLFVGNLKLFYLSIKFIIAFLLHKKMCFNFSFQQKVPFTSTWNAQRPQLEKLAVRHL